MKNLRIPKHGKGFRAGAWQVVNVFKRSPGFGPDVWVQELAVQSKKPEETADSMRNRLLEPNEKAWDVILEAIDR